MKKRYINEVVECENIENLPYNIGSAIRFCEKMYNNNHSVINPNGLIETNYFPDKNVFFDYKSEETIYWHVTVMYLCLSVQIQNIYEMTNCNEYIYTEDDVKSTIKKTLKNKKVSDEMSNRLIYRVIDQYKDTWNELSTKHNDEDFVYRTIRNLSKFTDKETFEEFYGKYTIGVYKYGIKNDYKTNYMIEGIEIDYLEMYSLRKEFMFHGIKNIKKNILNEVNEDSFKRIYENLRVYKKRNKDELEYGDKDIQWDEVNKDLINIKNKLTKIVPVNTQNNPDCAESAVQTKKNDEPYKPTSITKNSPESAPCAQNKGENNYDTTTKEETIYGCKEIISTKNTNQESNIGTYRTTSTGIVYKYTGIDWND